MATFSVNDKVILCDTLRMTYLGMTSDRHSPYPYLFKIADGPTIALPGSAVKSEYLRLEMPSEPERLGSVYEYGVKHFVKARYDDRPWYYPRDDIWLSWDDVVKMVIDSMIDSN